MDELSDVLPGHYYCPRCGGLMGEKVPKDKFQIRAVFRIYCRCGYYYDKTPDEIGDWRNGSATGSEPVSQGSNP